MESRDVTLKLPLEQLHALQQLAQQQDVTVGQVVRSAITAELQRRAKKGRSPNRASEELVAPLRARLAGDFAEALSWEELEMRLKAKGFKLRESGGGLALHGYPSGDRVCKASELGFSYARLLERFQRPFPRRGHTQLASSVQGHGDDGDEDIQLFEPF